MGEDRSPSRCQAASRELDRLLEEFAEEPEETDAELEALDELHRSLEVCIRHCKGEEAEPQAPEEGEEPEEAEAFCRDALEKFARQLLRRCCAPF